MLKVEWIDGGREPTQKPNPDYPDGIDVKIGGGPVFCMIDLPYPAKRIGHYLIQCDTCHTTALITTAGRPDDPRSVKIPCKRRHDA